MLFNGGFQLNCPAARGYSEAKSIWPHTHCDILLSLGTGTTLNRSPHELHTLFGVTAAIAGDISDAERAWDDFQDGPKQRFRLNPVYRGKGFELDDVRQLNDIQKQIEEWIAAKDDASSCPGIDGAVLPEECSLIKWYKALYFHMVGGSPETAVGNRGQ